MVKKKKIGIKSNSFFFYLLAEKSAVIFLQIITDFPPFFEPCRVGEFYI